MKLVRTKAFSDEHQITYYKLMNFSEICNNRSRFADIYSQYRPEEPNFPL